VRLNDSSAAGKAGQFETTQWTAVLLSAQSGTPAADTAREGICRRYWYPLYAFIRKRGYTGDDARDLTQGFFLSLFDRKALRQVTPLKGKFRSFLLASLKNYLSTEFHRENAIKRGRNIEFVPLDFELAEDRYSKEPADVLTAEKIFDARWAMTLLNETTERLREEYRALGKETVFTELLPFLDLAGSSTGPGYELAAKKLNLTLGGAKTLVHRFRKRYAEVLREAVAQTVTDPNEIDEEIRALCNALIAAEGRLGP
jgi:DNA-directed RNA polymerase specialized sigma24 family protein